MHSVLWSTLSAALALLLTAGPSWSQQILPGQSPDTAAADSVDADQPEPLPDAADVAGRWSQLADSAAEATDAIGQIGSTADLAGDVRDAAARQTELAALLDALESGDYVRPERISRLRDQVELEAQRLGDVRARTLERLERLGDIRTAWLDRQEFWRRWRTELSADADFAAVRPDMERASASIDSVLDRASTALDELLVVQRSIDAVRADNERILTALETTRAESRAALMQRGEPVLFSSAHRAQLAEGGWSAWSPAAALRPAAYPAFLRDHAGILIFHLLLAIALALIARRVGRSERAAQGWSGLLDHPWALGIFASTALALQRVLLAPPLWDVLLWAAFAATAAILARALFAAWSLRVSVYIFGAFYPTFLLFEAMQLPAPVFRTALAAVAATALVAFAFLARRRTAVAAAEGVNDPRRIWPLRVGAVMWAVVLGAIILGYDALARWILHAAVTSGAVIFMALVLLALIRGTVASLVVSDPSVRRHLAMRVAVRLAQRLIFVVQIVTVIGAVLMLLDIWQLTESPVATWQRITDAGFDVGPVRITIGRILLALLVVYIATTISWLVRNVVRSEVFERHQFDAGVGESINRLVHYLFIIIGFIVALAVLGVELRNFAIVAGALGIGIGFGLQNVVSNFASGLILLFERPVRIGDTVIVGGEWGTIRKIGLRSTIMQTFDQSEMIVPNTDLVSEKVVNWTLSNQTARVILEVGVAYGTDITAVLRILAECAGAHESTLPDPPPQALFIGFGESSLDFELRIWVSEIRNRLEVRSAVLTEIERRLTAAGIEIPFPQRDLHVRSVDAAAARALARPEAPEREG